MSKTSLKKILTQNALDCLQVQRDIERLQIVLQDLHEQTHSVNQKIAELESRKNWHHQLLSQSVLDFMAQSDSKNKKF